MIPKKPDHVRWTSSQWEAIYYTGENVLVSAGAGSGKTAVLTERVIELVKQGIDINRLLVVTFTKAAALEMKERIRERLLNEISEGAHHLIEQLSLLEVANFSTFDSFSMFIVKKYAHALNLSTSINIGDEIALEKLKNDVLDPIIEAKFASKDKAFYQFARVYSKKGSQSLKAMILSLSDQFLKNPDYEGILETSLEPYHSLEFYEQLKNTLNDLTKETALSITKLLETCESLFSFGAQNDYVLELKESFEPFILNPSVDAAYYFLNEYQFPRLKSKVFEGDDKKELDQLRDTIKALLESLKEFAKEPFDAFKEKHQTHAPFLEALKEVTTEFLKSYLKTQKEKGVFDFQTMALLSLEVLKNHPHLLNDLKNNYDHIMVDEYQDTNALQDRLIEMLGNDNLYLVGDIKQSIYRFRDATPELFQEKYERYLNESKGKVIHLNENFRSRFEVIDQINTIFKKSFSKPFGGIEYDEAQALKFGLNDYLKEKDSNQSYGLILNTYSENLLELYKDLWAFPSNPNKSGAMVEAFFMIQDIKTKIDQKFQVYDKDLKTLRDARYHDFMILIDRKSYFEDYQALFQNANIPLFIHKQETFISHEDVLVIVHLFKLYLSLTSEEMALKHFKYAFLSVAYSYISDASQDDIVLFLDGLHSLKPALVFAYASKTSFKEMFSFFEDLIKKQDLSLLSDTLMAFNIEFELLNKATTLSNVEDIEDRFLFILDKLRGFEQSETSLEEVVDYFDYTIKNHRPDNALFSMDIDYIKGTMVVEDHVNLMTIHKSKGLEFPVVYYPQLFSSMRSRADSDVFYDSRYGIVMPFMLQGKEKTLLHVLLKKDALEKDISERLRVFYVALTRAREQCVVYHQEKSRLMPLKMFENETKIPDYLMIHMKTFSDVIQGVLNELKGTISPLNVDETSFIKKQSIPSLNLDLETVDPKRLYRYQTLDIETKVQPVKQYSMNPLIKGDASLEKALELGNTLHEWLEILKFDGDIDQQLDTMNASPLIKSVVHAFFDQPLIQRLRLEKVYKELPFIFESPEETTRGIIDLIFETHDTFYIIDYKTRTIDKEAYLTQVKGYMDYLKTKTNKTVVGYLYSLLDHTLKQVQE